MAKKFSELTSGAVSEQDYVPTARGTGNYKVLLPEAIRSTIPTSTGGNNSGDSGKAALYDASGSLRASGVLAERIEVGSESNLGRIILRNGIYQTELYASAADNSWTFGDDSGMVASRTWVSSNFSSNPLNENLVGFSPSAGEVTSSDTILSGLEKSYYAATSAIQPSGGVVTGTLQSAAYTYLSSAIITNSGNLTLDSSYNGKMILSNNASAITYTVPLDLPNGFSCSVLQNGTGITTFDGASGVSVNSYGGLKQIAGQYGSAYLQWTSSNNYILAGNLS